MVFCFLFSALVMFSFVGLARFIITILYNCSTGTFARFVKHYLYNCTIVVEQRTPRRALISIGMSSRRHPQPGFPPHNLLCPISHPVSPGLFVRFQLLLFRNMKLSNCGLVINRYCRAFAKNQPKLGAMPMLLIKSY